MIGGSCFAVAEPLLALHERHTQVLACHPTLQLQYAMLGAHPVHVESQAHRP